jgi:hypothetical protein
MLVALIFWVLCAIAAGQIGARKGCGNIGFFLGFLLGPFGILFAFLMTGNRWECSSCKTLVHKDASICPMCRSATGVVTPDNKKAVYHDRHGQAYESFDNGSTWRKA